MVEFMHWLEGGFFVKLMFVTLGVATLRTMQGELIASDDASTPYISELPAWGDILVVAARPTTARMKRLSLASIVYWVAAITFGRRMAYTFFRFWQ